MFKEKKIHQTQTSANSNKKISYTIGKKMLRVFIILGSIILVFFIGKRAIYKTQAAIGIISTNTVGTISSTLGTDMIRDQQGNINILLAGYGGENHDGWFLTDSLMVASRDTKQNSITFISIPRDLYVQMPNSKIVNRINLVFRKEYSKTGSIEVGANALMKKVQEITSLEIPYYALVDFDGFEKLIDSMGGVTIDVPERIYDTTYPNSENRGYITYHIERGTHTLSGSEALKYARSRHSTSDFSRSQRQQDLIKAIIKQALTEKNITNVATIKQLYENYTQMVNTNINIQEVLGMLKDGMNLQHTYNFNITNVCSNIKYEGSKAWCFLFVPNRDQFWGASVLLPVGASVNSISYYEYIRNFSSFIVHNQGMLTEKANITINNGIDPNYALQQNKGKDWFANKLGIKLKKYGFNISNVNNADTYSSGTTITIKSTGNYEETLLALSKFINIDDVILDIPEATQILNTGIESTMIEEVEIENVETKVDIIITLGNTYIDSLTLPFNYYK